MIGFILRAITSGLWKPIAALLGVLGVYMAGSRNARQKAQNEGLKDQVKAHEVRNEVDNRVAVERDARDRLRSDWSE